MSTPRLHVLGLFIVSTSLMFGCASGPYTHLSQRMIVSTKEYPEELKKRIVEFKATLSVGLAMTIVDKALVGKEMVENVGSLLFHLVKIDGLEWVQHKAVVDGRERVNNKQRVYYHYEPVVVQVPFSDIRYIRIYTPPNERRDEYWGPIDVTTDSLHYRQRFFHFYIRPGADEIELIASLLYLCRNLED